MTGEATKSCDGIVRIVSTARDAVLDSPIPPLSSTTVPFIPSGFSVSVLTAATEIPPEFKVDDESA